MQKNQDNMFTLFVKELNAFFSSLIAYLVIGIFLITTGLFLWVIPGQFNVLESGYASLAPLFYFAPWIFLFLIPAVSMRMFSEEKHLGTIELLFTKPISDVQIILAKYFATLSLVLFSLLPVLVYYVSIWFLSNPVGNIDNGGFWGSFIGLFFLAAVYVAIGIWSSSLTRNQIIAFIISLALSYFFYTGFDAISMITWFNGYENYITALGISEHYQSMSRGVLDSRDLIYFISVIVFFITLTKIQLESRKY